MPGSRPRDVDLSGFKVGSVDGGIGNQVMLGDAAHDGELAD